MFPADQILAPAKRRRGGEGGESVIRGEVDLAARDRPRRPSKATDLEMLARSLQPFRKHSIRFSGTLFACITWRSYLSPRGHRLRFCADRKPSLQKPPLVTTASPPSPPTFPPPIFAATQTTCHTAEYSTAPSRMHQTR
jgi:hypothetical protein